MQFFQRSIITGVLLTGIALFVPAHAQEEGDSSGAESYVAHYTSIAQSFGCNQVVTTNFNESGTGLLGFIPEGQDPANWSRMVNVNLWFLQVEAPAEGEESETDLDDVMVEAKDHFIDTMEAKGKITAKKESERANGSPLIYLEFTSGKGDKQKSGAAVFAQQSAGLAAGTQITVRGQLDDASKATMKQLYTSMNGK